MYPLCKIVGRSVQGIVMPQEDWVPRVTLRTVRNRLLQWQLRSKCPVACILLTPCQCRLRRQRCPTRAYWKKEWRYVVFSDESRFYLCASDGRVLVRGTLRPNCIRSRHTKPKSGLMVWGTISYPIRDDGRKRMRTTRVGGTAFKWEFSSVEHFALRSVDMLPWAARSPEFSPIGSKALTVPV
ncbi:transposable element Tcb2 transposase [Trichonephila clavipes]|nr:transposable element Tcb2 transposase [Trichonephila clavipes]